jgi:hypothetical protein
MGKLSSAIAAYDFILSIFYPGIGATPLTAHLFLNQRLHNHQPN